MHAKKIVERRAQFAEVGRDIWGLCVIYLCMSGYHYLVLWTDDYCTHWVDLGRHEIAELLHGQYEH